MKQSTARRYATKLKEAMLRVGDGLEDVLVEVSPSASASDRHAFLDELRVQEYSIIVVVKPIPRRGRAQGGKKSRQRRAASTRAATPSTHEIPGAMCLAIPMLITHAHPSPRTVYSR